MTLEELLNPPKTVTLYSNKDAGGPNNILVEVWVNNEKVFQSRKQEEITTYLRENGIKQWTNT